MPELPEVETVRRGLKECILNKRIIRVEVFCEKSFIIGEASTTAFFKRDLKQKMFASGNSHPKGRAHAGQLREPLASERTSRCRQEYAIFSFKTGSLKVPGKSSCANCPAITEIRRFGKMLVFDLSNGFSMMVHLRMTGQLIYAPEGAGVEGRFAAGHPSENFVDELPNGQTRVVFWLDGGKLFFNDQRKFGFCKVVRTEEVERDGFVRKLGPEPWEMGGEEFYRVLQRRKGTTVKAVLLDQGVMAGLGNIYADEAAFYAGVYPGVRAGEVSREEAGRLVEGARVVMERAIEAGGSTMRNYVKADGSRGDYLEKFAQVFSREGEKCLRCGGEILKTRVAGRGTYYCPECQRGRK